MRTSIFPCLATLALAACGNAPPAASPATTTGHEHGEEHGHGHGHGHDGKGHKDEKDMPAPVRDFHAVLAPLWHADKGPERAAKTCAQAATLREKAQATGDAELVAVVAALATECDSPGRPKFEERFHAVHERFHVVAK
jgi:hypothetical protein